MKKLKLSKQEKILIKSKRKGIISEFKTFITRGNVVDMATGVVVATAFTKIVTSLTNDIIMPFINWIVFNFTKGKEVLLITTLNNEPYFIDQVDDADVITKVVNPKCIYINWGNFIQQIVNFLLIAFVIFMIIKIINSVRAKINYLKELQKKEENEKALKAKQAEIEATIKEQEAQAILKAEADKAKATEVSTNELLVEIINLLQK